MFISADRAFKIKPTPERRTYGAGLVNRELTSSSLTSAFDTDLPIPRIGPLRSTYANLAERERRCVRINYMDRASIGKVDRYIYFLGVQFQWVGMR